MEGKSSILGRDDERKVLKRLFESNQSEFLAVYGRRRVGKTYLIRKYFAKEMIFESAGLMNGTRTQQLENFWLALNERVGLSIIPPKTWLQAFALLKTHIDGLKSKKKKVIFLDEISWFDTPKSGFISALDNFWNQYCSKREDILLIICGSAASWIINKVVNSRGGLHNRLTQSILLDPFNLKETEDYLKSNRVKLNRKDIAQLYMVTGGIPFYLKNIIPGKSLPQLLDDLFFSKQAKLKREYENLYAALFRNHEIHLEIIAALAKKNSGLRRKEIIKLSNLSSGGGLSLALEELEQCGFIKKIGQYHKDKEDAVYRLIDEYSYFYHNFLKRNNQKLDGKRLFAAQKFKIWSGYAFENLCYRHLDQIAKALGIEGIIYNTYSFLKKGKDQEKGAQIDMVIDRADNTINLLEIKFQTGELIITKKYAQEIDQRKQIFKRTTGSRKNLFVTLITPYGARHNEHFLTEITNELKLEALF